MLTAERSHRAAVVSLVPGPRSGPSPSGSSRGVLDALEPGDLAGVSTLGELVERVARLRGTVTQPTDPAADDVDDPYRRSTETHERVADEIDAAVAVIADALRAIR